MRRTATTVLFATLLLSRITPAGAQLVEAECASSWPGFPFPEGIHLERAQRAGLDVALREFGARDILRAGQPPARGGATPSWIWHADLAALARSSDLGVFVSRFNEFPRGWGRGVTDGFIVSAWAFTATGTRRLVASTWLYVKNDRRPVRPQCGLQIRSLTSEAWSALRQKSKVGDIAAAAPPPPSLRDADNTLIAASTCRARWPPIIAASVEDRGRFLMPDVGEVIGGANLRAIIDQLPDAPVRWRRLKFLASRDGMLGLSIGRLVSCDDAKSMQTYLSAWVREGETWRLELLAIVP